MIAIIAVGLMIFTILCELIMYIYNLVKDLENQ